MEPNEYPSQCNIEQYRMLLRCAEKQDLTEWNEWIVQNLDNPVLLCGAQFPDAMYLQRAILRGAQLQGAYLEDSQLQGAILQHARLHRAKLYHAQLQGADLRRAQLQSADMEDAQLQKAKLVDAQLQGAHLTSAQLQGANLRGAQLQGAFLLEAQLHGAQLVKAELHGAQLVKAELQGADFSASVVDAETLIWDCAIDERTDFTGVALDAARVHPGLKQLLEYNIRRRRWEEYYTKHPVAKYPVALFWLVSDYGRCTGRILGVFFCCAIAFAVLYYAAGLLSEHGLVSNLFTAQGTGETTVVPPRIVPVRAVYFSVITMTTLGFGDLYAEPTSLLGHLCLIAEVMLGYALLGALVTRFAVLFTAGGPPADHLMKMRKTSWRGFRQMVRVDVKRAWRRYKLWWRSRRN